MFFRRQTPKPPTFAERVEAARAAGFHIEPLGTGRVRARRDQCAAIVEDAAGSSPRIERAGLVLGDEIALLVDGGYQKFFVTPQGRRKPALAAELKALHDFEEDLREALGLPSLYNESLGTRFDLHVYDRLKGRDGHQ
ncbi:MAG: hypothetical protein RMK57_05435 [Bryobacterales bacterium]|nr:hypothetical protein [Bryobacteraceae bacterium]MDW8353956.1 hypothetical protein [Bryobacterales bacterium]